MHQFSWRWWYSVLRNGIFFKCACLLACHTNEVVVLYLARQLNRYTAGGQFHTAGQFFFFSFLLNNVFWVTFYWDFAGIILVGQHWVRWRLVTKRRHGTTHEKKIVTVSSRWAHCELTVVTAPGPMITAQSRLGEVTAQSRLGHSSVTPQSQLNHGIFSMITARSQLNHGPGHGSVTAGCDHFGYRELTVSSPWAHGEQSRWPIFFSWALETMPDHWRIYASPGFRWLSYDKMMYVGFRELIWLRSFQSYATPT